MTGEEVHGNHKNPVPAVDVLIAKDHNSKILLVRRKSDPFKGMLSILGGFIYEGETAENAMTREAKEETSLVVEPIAILGVYSDPPERSKNAYYLSYFHYINSSRKRRSR